MTAQVAINSLLLANDLFPFCIEAFVFRAARRRSQEHGSGRGVLWRCWRESISKSEHVHPVIESRASRRHFLKRVVLMLARLGVIQAVMFQAKVREVLFGPVCWVLVEVRDLSMLFGEVLPEITAQAAPTSAFEQHRCLSGRVDTRSWLPRAPCHWTLTSMLRIWASRSAVNRSMSRIFPCFSSIHSWIRCSNSGDLVLWSMSLHRSICDSRFSIMVRFRLMSSSFRDLAALMRSRHCCCSCSRSSRRRWYAAIAMFQVSWSTPFISSNCQRSMVRPFIARWILRTFCFASLGDCAAMPLAS